MNGIVAELKRSLLNLLWPELCQACNAGLLADELTLCLQCKVTLPLPYHRMADEDPLTKSGLIGLPLLGVYNWMAFLKHGHAQQLIHKVKYGNQPELGIALGQLFGEALRSKQWPENTLLVPVPLHPARQRARGYNQAAEIAKGLSLALGYPIFDAVLIRPQVTESQTSKSRTERAENMKMAFLVPDDLLLQLADHHLVIVDDVLTTGATVGSCARALFAAGATKISVVTLAIAA